MTGTQHYPEKPAGTEGQLSPDIGRELVPLCYGDLGRELWVVACFSVEGLEAGTLHHNWETGSLLSFVDKRFKNRLRDSFVSVREKTGQTSCNSWQLLGGGR